MSTQPEALRLADALIKYLGGNTATQAAAELRRLHQFAEDQIGRATAAEAALQMTKVTHALKLAAVERQRDALLEALNLIASDACADMPAMMQNIARAAIAKAEGEQA